MSGIAWRQARGLAPLAGALALTAAGVLASWGLGSLPASLALSALGLLAAATLLATHGAAARGSGQAEPLFAWFCLGWVVAGVLGAGIAIVQVFAPGLPDGDWIARSGLPGRAVGNLRQPNHLSSVLLWACIAVAVLADLRRLRRPLALALMALLVFAVVLTASRTGLVSVVLLALWALLDRRLGGATRALLLATPALYALAWLGMAGWADAGHVFGGTARLAEADLSSSRFGIWSNTLALIAQQPWTGVGFGEFNLAWSLTPFPGRPVAFFDHSHNLPLQLLVELGLPLGGAVLALLLWALWQPLRRWGGADLPTRGALLMVLMIGVHSLLEYPLWYAHFLLPAAWAWGFAGGHAADVRPEARLPAAPRAGRGFALAGALLVAGALAAVADYWRVVVIFEARAGAPPLAERIADGRRSWLFAHHADYAAATSGLPQPDDLGAFDGAVHYLLDTRLMTAWAQALNDAGRAHAARHLAARLREFRNPKSEPFFAPCTAASSPPPFQCQAPAGDIPWRAFVAP